jgi:hypothetical protein
LIDVIDLAVDLITTALVFGAGFYAFKIRSTFKGGILWRPWRVIGPAPIIYGLARIAETLSEVLDVSVFREIQALLELIFVLTLAYGFYLFYKAWNPKEIAKTDRA